MKKIISQIIISVHPAGGRGGAHCSWSRDGKVNGGHLSGDDPPFVHIDEKEFPEGTIDEIWKEAEALDEKVLELDIGPDPGWKGYTELEIFLKDKEKPMRLCWPSGDEGVDPRVRKLVELLMKHRIGCW